MWQSLVSLFLSLAAFYLVGFLFWRRLKSDYTPSILISIYIIAVLGAVIAWQFIRFFPSPFSPPPEVLWFIGSLAGLLFSLRLLPSRRLNFWELADHLWLTLVGLAVIAQAIQLAFSFNLAHLASVGWWLLVWGISFWLSFNFRQLSWYPSGKIGLSATLGPACYFLGAALLAFFAPPALYWSHKNTATAPWYLLPALILVSLSLKRAQLKIHLPKSILKKS